MGNGKWDVALVRVVLKPARREQNRGATLQARRVAEPAGAEPTCPLASTAND